MPFSSLSARLICGLPSATLYGRQPRVRPNPYGRCYKCNYVAREPLQSERPGYHSAARS
jgi:hypothetical protein